MWQFKRYLNSLFALLPMIHQNPISSSHETPSAAVIADNQTFSGMYLTVAESNQKIIQENVNWNRTMQAYFNINKNNPLKATFNDLSDLVDNEKSVNQNTAKVNVELFKDFTQAINNLSLDTKINTDDLVLENSHIILQPNGAFFNVFYRKTIPLSIEYGFLNATIYQPSVIESYVSVPIQLFSSADFKNKPLEERFKVINLGPWQNRLDSKNSENADIEVITDVALVLFGFNGEPVAPGNQGKINHIEITQDAGSANNINYSGNVAWTFLTSLGKIWNEKTTYTITVRDDDATSTQQATKEVSNLSPFLNFDSGSDTIPFWTTNDTRWILKNDTKQQYQIIVKKQQKITEKDTADFDRFYFYYQKTNDQFEPLDPENYIQLQQNGSLEADSDVSYFNIYWEPRTADSVPVLSGDKKNVLYNVALYLLDENAPNFDSKAYTPYTNIPEYNIFKKYLNDFELDPKNNEYIPPFYWAWHNFNFLHDLMTNRTIPFLDASEDADNFALSMREVTTIVKDNRFAFYRGMSIAVVFLLIALVWWLLRRKIIKK